MRKLLVPLGLILGLTVTLSIAAEENKAAAPKPPSEAEQLIDRRMVVMQEKLNLTPEQAQKIRAIMLRDHEKFLKMRDDSSLTPEDRSKQAREMFRTSAAELQSLLTSEQKEIWKAEAEKERKTEREHQAGQGAAAPEQKK